MKTTIAAFTGAATLATASLAHAQQCREVSEDGRLTVVGRGCESDEGGIAGSQSADVPFAATPDWVNALRLQISSVRIADMNGDGLNDIVASTYISQSSPAYTDFHNYIYYNTGTGPEATPSWQSTDTVHANDLQIADINGDSFLDIFSANGGGSFSPSRIYWGSATGPSAAPGWASTVSPGTWATGAAIFDFDHDGDADVITTNQGIIMPNQYRPIYIYANNAGTLATTPAPLGIESSIQHAAAFADYDHNGWEDLAVSKWTNGFQSGVYRNLNGTLETTQAWTRGVSATDKGVAWADVDGNGWIDLAIGCNGGTQLFSNDNGTLTLAWTSLAPFPSQQEVAFADVDGDGDPDLADVNFSTGRTNIHLNRDGVLDATPTWVYDATTAGNALAFGDLNHDGRMDLVIGYSGEPSIAVFYGLPPAGCDADQNADGQVNVNDLLAVITNWGPCAAPPLCPGDVNGNQSVDVNDLLAVITSWGACP